jgi:hypothetical protein
VHAHVLAFATRGLQRHIAQIPWGLERIPVLYWRSGRKEFLMFSTNPRHNNGWPRRRRSRLGLALLGLVTAAALAAATTPARASTTLGVPGDGLPDFVYNPTNGDVTFVRDGFNSAAHVRTLVMLSAGSRFITGVGLASQNLSGFDIDQVDQQSIARFGGNGIATATLDLGNVLPTGLDQSVLLGDLSVFFNYDGSGATDPNGVPADLIAPVVAAVPLPSTTFGSVALAASVGVVGFVGRRRRRLCTT